MKTYKLKGIYGFYKSFFENKGVEISDLDWIVCEVLNIKRTEIFSVDEICKKDFDKIVKFVKLRLKGKPIDRVLKKREFFGRDFKIGKFVLSPRSETEILCDLVIKNSFPNSKILEIGTGSGAIAVTLKKEKDSLEVVATDVSFFALQNAKKNAVNLNANITFVKSFLFDNVPNQKFDVIVSNPPYIPTGDILTLDEEVKRYDPKLALDGGADGLFFYREIIKKAKDFLLPSGKIFFEIGINQSKQVCDMLEKDFCDVKVVKDFSGIDRIVWAKKKEE